MEPFTLLSEKISGFPGYGNQDQRRSSDESVRAYAGERLSELQDRLGETIASAALARPLLRCEFINQRAFKNFEYADTDDAHIAAIASADAAIVVLADDAVSVDAAGIDAYASQVEAALDARDRAMEAVAARP